MNRGSFPCDLNAQCGGGGTAENNCTTVRYSWAAMSGATILDACDGGVVLPTGSGATTYASAVPTPIPFPFALFGRAVDAVRPSVAPFAVLMSMGQPNGFFPESAGAESGQPGLGFGVGSRSDAMCIRTFGTAPNRRFVVEWLGVHASEETRRTVVEAVLEEGTNAIEMRYGPTDRVLEPSAFTYDYAGPWISGGPNEWVLPPRLIVTPPMTVRFTPR